ncbi:MULTISPECIES: HNH endonuclease [Pseudomonas]|jgi:5-methylcytosine-specific restriction protein A|uniref:HNH endonuclease n=1 Tax=Pseudomonas syringae TaxID=317 RepID=A0A085VA77_PSESX|nr:MULTISPECIES: HNH endonuclease [Pseudomonas]EPJ89853.1 putative 5-methylcytosine-specific restriction enzyme [Pseudomonas sp. CFII64]KFE52340.1 HNH endonuclease [Pseudomonas syringae]
MDTEKSNKDWSDLEIQAAVDAYLGMLKREQSGQPINKAYENRVLREGALATRTKGSVEFRMQNISTVLEGIDRDRIEGYKPAQNVGANVVRSILKALDAAQDNPTPEDYTPTADEITLEQRASKLEQKPLNKEPKGILQPKQTSAAAKSYVRDPEVRAWVRQHANGNCEGCGLKAPFEKDGRPFLEVHHVKHLAQNGSDRISNAVALCPNCHRRCHHSSDRDLFSLSLYERLGRLIKEE